MYNNIVLKYSYKDIDIYKWLPRELKFYILHFVFGNNFHIKGNCGYNNYISLIYNTPSILKTKVHIKENVHFEDIPMYHIYNFQFFDIEYLYYHIDINNLYTDSVIQIKDNIKKNEQHKSTQNMNIQYSCSSKREISKNNYKKINNYKNRNRKYNINKKICKKQKDTARAYKYNYYCESEDSDYNTLILSLNLKGQRNWCYNNGVCLTHFNSLSKHKDTKLKCSNYTSRIRNSVDVWPFDRDDL